MQTHQENALYSGRIRVSRESTRNLTIEDTAHCGSALSSRELKTNHELTP